MLITCPSCGRSHDSAQYRGAFEIACDCGYSILMPDEEALAAESSAAPGFQAPPIAMDEEDNSMAIDVDLGTHAQGTPEDNLFAPFDGAIDMTPESELPAGMVYDPDEAEALAASKDAWSESANQDAAFLDPFTPTEANDEPPTPQVAVTSPAPEPESVASKTSAQPVSQSEATELVQKNQSAALGHLVGSLYDLEFKSLTEDLCLKLSARCEEILRGSPWLKQLLQDPRTKCAPEDFVTRKTVLRIPEVLALELFLYCYEIGGRCSFSATEMLESHPA